MTMMAINQFVSSDPAVAYYVVTGAILLILLAILKCLEINSRARGKRYGLSLK